MLIKRFNIAATPIRRPLVFATLLFMLLGHLLPGGHHWQIIRILDAAGNPQKTFAIRTDDPKLGVITSNIAKANSKTPELSTQYVTTKWDMEVAEIYARDPRSKTPEPDSTPEPASTNVKLASFVPNSKEPSQPVAVSTKRPATDWAEYWGSLQTGSSDKLSKLSTRSKESNIFQRLELSETIAGKRPTILFAIQLLLSVAGFILMGRWLGKQTVQRLGLRVPMAVQVPKEWIGRPLLSRISIRRFTRHQTLEAIALSACLLLGMV